MIYKVMSLRQQKYKIQKDTICRFSYIRFFTPTLEDGLI